MKILIASPEAVPYAKTGGLADVVGSLVKEYRRTKEDAYVVLPLYKSIKNSKKPPVDTGLEIKVPVGGKVIKGRIFSDRSSAYFIGCDKFFNRQELYGTQEGDYIDNASRFIFFSRGVLEACKKLKLKPDVIHCNDWQTGLIPLYLKTIYRNDKFLKNTAGILTIHNLGYQGLFPPAEMLLTGYGWELFTPEGIEFYGKVNFLKAGIISADIINTVSNNYSKEILNKEFGFGLDGVLRNRAKDLYGVINGIDYDEWDPSRDKFIPANYSNDEISGKGKCKKELLRSLFGSSDDIDSERIPLVGMVGRLAAQKGFDLVIQSVDELLSMGVKLIILGKGEEIIQRSLYEIAKKYKGSVYVNIGFEEPFAHRVYAGSDF
ncbi:MAG: hypothetical protein A2Y97_14210, partial [Nitrospirae bacterium RBG_13_39_12]